MKTFLSGLALLLISQTLLAQSTPPAAPKGGPAAPKDTTTPILTREFYSVDHKVIRDEGTLVNSKKEGWWSFYRENGIIASDVLFRHDHGVQMKLYNAAGKPGRTTDTVEVEASFPGGDAAWNAYFQAAMLKKSKYLARKNAQGHLSIQFVVERDGALGEITLLKATGTELDDVVTEIIKNSPSWIPAVQYNLKVKVFRKQQLTYSLTP